MVYLLQVALFSTGFEIKGRFVAGGVLLLTATGFHIKGSMIFRRMMAEVNARLPQDAQISEMGLSLTRLRVMKLHRYYFPASNLKRDLYRWWYAMTAAFLAACACVLRSV